MAAPVEGDTARRGFGMPARVRGLMWLGAALLGAGAAYLLAVRGTALLLDMAAFGRFLLCL